MLLAARSMGSLNEDRLFAFGGQWSLTETMFQTVRCWDSGCISVTGAVVMLVQITDAGQAVPPPGM